MIFVYIVVTVLLLPCICIRLRNTESVQLFDKTDTVAIRGISAIFVMVAHYSIWFNQISDSTINRIVMVPIEQLGGIGVLLFFFVSGYGINESYGKKVNMNGFLSKRFYGVYLPYIFLKLITTTLLLCSIGVPSLSETILTYLQILIVPDWFIFVIILQYLSYYVSRKFFGRYDLVFSLLADVVMTVVFIVLDKPIGWFNALWLFTFGIVVSKHQEWLLSKIHKHYYQILAVSLLGFMLFGGVFAIYKGQAWANTFKPVAGFLLCISLCCIFRKIIIANKLILWFGKCSMYLYIVHMTVWDILINHFSDTQLVFCGSAIASIVLTEVIYLSVSSLVKLIKSS